VSSQDLKLGDFGENPQGTLDGDVVGGQQRDDLGDRPDACMCGDPIAGLDCWTCLHRRIRQ
jgi:hypothetical protein